MHSARPFDPVILREYDVRGRIGVNLDKNDAYTIGRAFATFIRRATGTDSPALCLGYDGRLSTLALVTALTAGLIDSGAHVTDIGLGPSPMLYYAVHETGAQGGIMVTGSHNPPDYNGFKMLTPDGPVFGPAIAAIGALAERQDFETGSGTRASRDLRDEYVARLLADAIPSRPLKIAWDAGSGAAGDILRRLTARLPGTHILLYDAIDGTFPHHHPDPTVDANLADLRDTVLRESCDFGVAFDGDGDRIGAVDEQGNIVRCDTLLALYARDVLAQNPGAPIIGDVKCSQGLFDEITRLGGRPVMSRSGHSPLKSRMIEENAPLGGELSGHIFFADRYYGYDDGLYGAIRLMNALAGEQSLSQACARLPRWYSTPEIRIDVAETDKFALIDRLASTLSGKHTEICTIDGLRVTTADGWWLLRASNTQGALVCRAEGKSEAALQTLLARLEKEVAKLGYALKVPS